MKIEKDTTITLKFTCYEATQELQTVYRQRVADGLIDDIPKDSEVYVELRDEIFDHYRKIELPQIFAWARTEARRLMSNDKTISSDIAFQMGLYRAFGFVGYKVSSSDIAEISQNLKFC